jgi:hypothetical protein
MKQWQILIPIAWLISPSPTAADDHRNLFSAEPSWTSGSQHCGGDGNARLIDIDTDGDLDLVTSAPNPRRWVIFSNQGGTLAAKPAWSSLETTDCDHISVLDFNDDGRPDLAGTHESHCSLYLNNLDRSPFPLAAQPDWETDIYLDANQIDFGDFDQDGDQDMLMSVGLPFLGLALFENFNGNPAQKPTQRIGIREYSEASIFADVDSDGDLDIVATYPRAGTVVIHQNRDGVFDNGTQIYLDEQVRHCQRVYCRDIDADGRMEILCAKGPWGSPGASVILSQTETLWQFKVTWRSPRNTGYHGFDLGDVDGDGDLDLAAADWSGRSVAVYLQSRGTFPDEPSWTARTRGPGHEVMFGDIDQDGDLDLVAGCLDQAYLFTNLLK